MARTMPGVFMFSILGEKKPRPPFGCRQAAKGRLKLLEEVLTQGSFAFNVGQIFGKESTCS